MRLRTDYKYVLIDEYTTHWNAFDNTDEFYTDVVSTHQDVLKYTISKSKKIYRFFNISDAQHQYLHQFIDVGNFNILKTHQFFNISHTKHNFYTGFLTHIALFAGKHKLFCRFKHIHGLGQHGYSRTTSLWFRSAPPVSALLTPYRISQL